MVALDALGEFERSPTRALVDEEKASGSIIARDCSHLTALIFMVSARC
jgi:hypothetical protein